MDFVELEKRLLALAEKDQAQPMKAYMKNNFEFLGVRSPDRRKAAKQFFKDFKTPELDWDFVEACWDQPYREFQYVAIDYLVAHKKNLVLADLPRLKNLPRRSPGGIVLTDWTNSLAKLFWTIQRPSR